MGNPSPLFVGPVRLEQTSWGCTRGNLDNVTRVNSKALAEDVVQLSTKAAPVKQGAKVTMKQLIELANKCKKCAI